MRKAREQYNANKQLVQHPENFTMRVVSKETAKEIDVYTPKVKTKSGMVKVFIPNEGGQAVKINRDKSITIGKPGDKMIRRVYKAGKDIFKTAEKLFAKYGAVDFENLPDDGSFDVMRDVKHYIMVNIGGKANFSKLTAFNMEMFSGYMNAWQPKDHEKYGEEATALLRERLITHMNVVSIHKPEGYADVTGEENAKKKRKRKNSRH